MKTQRLLVSIVAIAVLLLGVGAGLAAAQAPDADPAGVTAVALGTAFTYQGQLIKDGVPANGSCDIRFILYESGAGGSQIGPIVEKLAVVVTGGLFTVPDLDFGSGVFAGDKRWLEVAVKCPAGSGSYATVGDRQELTATPYALYATSAANAATAANATNATSAASAPWSGLTGVPAGFADGVDNDTTYSAGTGLTLVGTVFAADTAYLQRRVSGTCAAGSSIRVVNADGTVTCEATGAFWSLTGNAGTTPGTNFLGTTDNKVLELKVNGQRALRIEPNATSPIMVGGHSDNTVAAGAYGATIGGGGASGGANRVTDAYGTVGGGLNNQAGDAIGTVADRWGATVGGGVNNTASGTVATVGGGFSNAADGGDATVGGGYQNSASAAFATVGGGVNNAASAAYATVAGGYYNAASGLYATVAGGRDNTASGDYSFATGRQAKANTQGSFVWADSTAADFESTAANQFAVRANGGVVFNTGSAPVTVNGNTVWHAGNSAFWSLTGNTGTTPGTNFLGTTDNQALELKVNGQRALRIEPNATSPNMVGGYSGNTVTAGAYAATIGGGGASGGANRVTDAYGTVGGGRNNQAGDNAGTVTDRESATVGGGYGNTAGGGAATIGGGYQNSAGNHRSAVAGGESNSASGQYSFVGGGWVDIASGNWATVSGGRDDVASGEYATVPGGQGNTAGGAHSLAAGRRAKATNQGSFVWGDSTDADINSTADNQFVVRAYGGVKLVRGQSSVAPSSAALQVEQAESSGEGIWARSSNAGNPHAVLKLLKPSSSSNFAEGAYDGGAQKFHIDNSGTFVAGSDFAESLPAAGGKATYAPGDVLVLSTAQPGAVEKCAQPYDGTVIGVFSTRPAVLGADKDGVTIVGANEIPVAIVGIVPVKVSAENGAIRPGDLLTTSATPGHAMRCADAIQCFGRTIGKALEALDAGTGAIRVLVTLQ